MNYDVLIVGTGIAGLYTALNLRDDIRILMITKNSFKDCNSYLAQGGISTSLGFFDEENYNVRLKFLGREELKTAFGTVKTLKFRPYVMAGRVFKEKESLTLWVSADDNKIPLRIQADLAVGSLRADLEAFKGLKHSFKVEF